MQFLQAVDSALLDTTLHVGSPAAQGAYIRILSAACPAEAHDLYRAALDISNEELGGEHAAVECNTLLGELSSLASNDYNEPDTCWSDNHCGMDAHFLLYRFGRDIQGS